MPSDPVAEEALVTVATFEWLMHADLARARLEACGIAAEIADEHIGTIYWQYAKAIGGLRLQVGAEDVEDALAVLREPEQPVEAILSEVDARAERFFKTALFSLMAFPLAFYALWLLFDLFPVRAQLDRRSRLQVGKGIAVLALGWTGPIVFLLVRLLRLY